VEKMSKLELLDISREQGTFLQSQPSLLKRAFNNAPNELSHGKKTKLSKQKKIILFP